MKRLIIIPLKKIFMYLKKICALSLKKTIAVSVLSAMLAAGVAGYKIIKESHYRSICISLNYDGAQYGLTPSKGRFDINKIKSDKVIAEAIEKTGDKNLTVENVKPRITIDANMPKSSVDKTISSISSGGNYSYTPAEFVVYYSQKHKFGHNYTTDFLKALADSYKEFFAATYSDKNAVLELDDESGYENKDYDEICEIMTDKVNSMINYLGEEQEKGVDFTADATGYRYSDLITSLVNTRDVKIEKFNAYIQQNKVSKDKSRYLSKKKHLIDNEMRNYDYLNGASDISNASLKIYDARISGIAFVPTLDSDNEFYMSRTKTGIDNLSKISYQNGKKAAELKKTIDEYRDKYDKYAEAEASTDEMHDYADEMIADIEKSLKEISESAIKTDNEFIEKKNNNYLTVSEPKSYRVSVVLPVKYAILFFIILVAGMRILRVIKRLVLKFAARENEKDEFEAE